MKHFPPKGKLPNLASVRAAMHAPARGLNATLTSHLQQFFPARGGRQVGVNLVVNEHLAVQPIPALSNRKGPGTVQRRVRSSKA